jgi:hypothetical protein
MVKQAGLFIFLSLFWGLSFPCFPQSSPALERKSGMPVKSIAIMPFGGDDLNLSAPIHDAVITAINDLGGYTLHPVSASRFPEILYYSPDSPPDPRYLEGSHYALTGEYYFDTNNLFFLQIWLWDSSGLSLIYTDGLFGENIEDVLTHSPALVDWILSHLPLEQYIPTDREG